MQNPTRFSNIGSIYATLAKISNRPRYAFLVLQLVTEAADATNHSNRGGGRHAVYVVEPQILAAMGRLVTPAHPKLSGNPVQGQLFTM